MKINSVQTKQNSSNYGEKIKQLEKNSRAIRQRELETAFLSPEYWQILNKVERPIDNKGKLLLKGAGEIPIDIDIRYKAHTDPSVVYKFKHDGKEIGYLELFEKKDGAHIFKVENLDQKKYGGIMELSDRIAVENCLKRGLKDFEITGDAILNSHAIHYLSGKKFYPIESSDHAKYLERVFGTKNPNRIVEDIIKHTPKGKKFHTEILRNVSFYFPDDLIKKYIELAKKTPILR